jgi:hypothetical protein
MSTVGRSLAEARELYQLLQKIETKFLTVNREIKRTEASWRDAVNISYQLIDTMDALGVGPDLNQALAVMRRVLIMVNTLRASMLALQMTTPIGMVVAAAGVLAGVAAFSAAEGQTRS